MAEDDCYDIFDRWSNEGYNEPACQALRLPPDREHASVKRLYIYVLPFCDHRCLHPDTGREDQR